MSEFYGTFDGFTDYHSKRDSAMPADASDNEAVEAALLVCSEWLDGKYRNYFEGLKVGGRDQVREWPRDWATDAYGYVVKGVPREIEHATYELVLKWFNNPDLFNVDYTPPRYKRVSVDGAVSIEYKNFNSSAELQTEFEIVNRILSGLLAKYTPGGYSGLTGEVARA